MDVKCLPGNINEDLSGVSGVNPENAKNKLEEMDCGNINLNPTTAESFDLTPVNEENFGEIKSPENPDPSFSKNLEEEIEIVNNDDLEPTTEESFDLTFWENFLEIKSPENPDPSFSKNVEEEIEIVNNDDLEPTNNQDDDPVIINDLFLPKEGERAKARRKKQDDIIIIWEGKSKKPSTSSMPKKENKNPESYRDSQSISLSYMNSYQPFGDFINQGDAPNDSARSDVLTVINGLDAVINAYNSEVVMSPAHSESVINPGSSEAVINSSDSESDINMTKPLRKKARYFKRSKSVRKSEGNQDNAPSVKKFKAFMLDSQGEEEESSAEG